MVGPCQQQHPYAASRPSETLHVAWQVQQWACCPPSLECLSGGMKSTLQYLTPAQRIKLLILESCMALSEEAKCSCGNWRWLHTHEGKSWDVLRSR